MFALANIAVVAKSIHSIKWLAHSDTDFEITDEGAALAAARSHPPGGALRRTR
jgi:hypothetical protein